MLMAQDVYTFILTYQQYNGDILVLHFTVSGQRRAANDEAYCTTMENNKPANRIARYLQTFSYSHARVRVSRQTLEYSYN